MAQMTKAAAIILVLIMGVLVQILFAFADHQDSPARTAAEFSKAYFMLDPSMAKHMCAQRLTAEGTDLVDQYLHRAFLEAQKRGFGIEMMQHRLYNIETEILSRSETEAQVRITGKTRVCINPAFANVATVFQLGGTDHVDETINVVKEDGKWKVCGDVFAFPKS